jgi:hypothetical protein
VEITPLGYHRNLIYKAQEMAQQQNEPQKVAPEPEDETSSRGFLGLLQSVLAAIFGIQSEKNRQADFKKGDASQFIMMGIVAVVVIVVTMVVVVSSVLESAGR